MPRNQYERFGISSFGLRKGEKLWHSRWFKTTENNIEGTEIIPLCEALKTNTTLKTLRLSRKHIEKHPFCIVRQLCYFAVFQIIDNKIGDIGVTSLSEALRANTTLTEFNLTCIMKQTLISIRQASHFSFVDWYKNQQGTMLKMLEQRL